MNNKLAESDIEESCHRRGEDSVPEQRAREGQDSLHGPGVRGGAGVGGEHAFVRMVGKQLQTIWSCLRDHYR